MSKDILFEIGTEEIPARFMPPVISGIKESSERILTENRVNFGNITAYGTPRRIVVIGSGLADRQKEMTLEVSGPPVSAAYDKEGKPTRAAEGFAKAQGVSVSELKIKKTDKGEYVFFEKREEGKNTVDILPSLLEDLMASVSFPKSMRWNNTRTRFARPVKWILALFNGEQLAVKFAGVRSGRISYGHHFMSPAGFSVKGSDDYLDQLKKGFVIVDQAQRQKLIEEQIHAISIEKGGKIIGGEDLLEEITYLTEYPLAICGRFDDAYLSLPREVLITVMREHQRCFSLEDSHGRLLPCFIGISNTKPKDLNVIRNGYERVIRARLSDAKFFFEADCRKTLDEHAVKLKQAVFMNKLGTMWDKVLRLAELSVRISELMGMPEVGPAAERAAALSKSDLMTEMVGEFPEIQGIMGREYALRQGEENDVANAISEHYLPRYSGDLVPGTEAGKVLAIAEKIDNITGCFGIGNIPGGSNDPYALRRQALGILHILMTGKCFVSLKDIIRIALSVYESRIDQARNPEIISGIVDFFKERFNTFLTGEGYRYDVVRAVLSTGLDDVYDAFLRITALDGFRQRPEFESLTISFKRVMNIIPPDFNGITDENLLKEKEEQDLYGLFKEISNKVQTYRDKHDYENAFASVAELKPKVDLFFDKVLVMDKDISLRNNRLSLLNDLKKMFLTLADFTQIVVDG